LNSIMHFSNKTIAVLACFIGFACAMDDGWSYGRATHYVSTNRLLKSRAAENLQMDS